MLAILLSFNNYLLYKLLPAASFKYIIVFFALYLYVIPYQCKKSCGYYNSIKWLVKQISVIGLS